MRESAKFQLGASQPDDTNGSDNQGQIQGSSSGKADCERSLLSITNVRDSEFFC